MMMNGEGAGKKHTFTKSLFSVALMDIMDMFYGGAVS